jgi:PKD repeat protein
MKTKHLLTSILKSCLTLFITGTAVAQCSAAFTSVGNYTNNCQTFEFTNTSIAPSGAVYKWEFGDGASTSMGAPVNVYHNYTTNGVYTATLSVYTTTTSVFPCSTVSNTLSVNCGSFSCQAAFTSNSSSHTANFNATNSGSGALYVWDFGDMSGMGPSSGTTANHYYNNFGTYTVTLNVYAPTNTATPCASTTQVISISQGTVCNAAYSYTSNAGCGQAFFVNNSTGTGNTYFWDFGDGTTNVTTSSGWFSHTYSANGSYVVRLDVYQSSNTVTPCSSTQNTLSIYCPSLTCQVNSNFTLFADTANPGNYFAYDNSTGTGSLSYLWDFGDGNTSTQQYPFHQYAVPGQYVVCLQVTSLTNSITCSDTYCDSSSVHRMAAGFQMSSITVVPQTVTGIKNNGLVKSLTAYPNPFNDQLIIELELNANTSNINYEVCDALGKVVMKNKITDLKTNLNTGTLSNGFYFLSVKDDNGNTLRSMKIVK